jgi:hypothetical protein
MEIWSIALLFSAALVAAAAIYTLIRWRRAPAALRGISLTGLACFGAGLLLGMWLLHETESRSVTRSSTPSARKASTGLRGSRATKLVALGPRAVQVYDLCASGDAPMLASIAGPHTGMNQSGEAVDMDMDDNGDTYVLQNSGFPKGSTVLKFPAGSSGDASPTKIIAGPATSLLNGSAIAAAPDGSHIFVVSLCGPEPSVSCIVEFPSEANGNSTPKTTITFPSGYNCDMNGGVTLDLKGNLWVADNEKDCISELPAGASGAVMPITTIWGPNTGLDGPARLVLDEEGDLYVANRRGPSITVYKPGSHEDSAPLATIFGPRTELADPSSITVDQQGAIYVEDRDRLLEFKAGSNGDASPEREIRIPALGFPSTIIVANW